MPSKPPAKKASPRPKAALKKSRMQKTARKRKAQQKKKRTPRAPHLCEQGVFEGVLSRNTTYRDDARGELRGQGIYDNPATILAGIQKRDKATKQPALVGGLTQAQRVPLYFLDASGPSGMLNFSGTFAPYRNQAHHILVCEVFYDKKWTAEHLNIVKQSGYDVNNPKNIIYLPQCYGAAYLRDYHNLPDHSQGHPTYSEKVLSACTEVWNMVDDAVKKEDCEDADDLREKILKKLQQIEKTYTTYIKARGAKSLA